HEINLQSGYLNLGSKTLTVGAGIISRNTGAFNGGTGTYIINTNHVTPKLEDAYFTIDGTPTLYNLTVAAAHETTNDLTVNGNLYLNGFDLTIASALNAAAPKLLTVYGNLSRNAGEIAGSVTLSRLVLAGTGTVANGLSNAYFNGGAATTVQLEVARQETLGGNLNIANTSYLRVNTGINDFNLGIYKLTFDAASFITMISGGIKAGTNSTVDLSTSIVTVPASMFRNNECYNLTIGQDITIQGDLAINGTWTGAFDVTTGDNILTIGASAVIPALGSSAYIKGNLRRTVVNNPATIFYVGDATNYYPVTLRFANATSSQKVVVKPHTLDPADGRGGDPKYSVNAYWDITPEGTAPVDSLKAIFQWPNTLDGGTTASTNASFPAKWTGSYWYDYRSKLSSFTVANPRVLTMASYPIANPAALNGVWAIFNATDTTKVAKDRAISTSRNKLVITKIDPLPVKLGLPFKVTVQLQNQYGQPITTTTPFE
ncbi:MAG TPA: hypothetical protein PKY56_14050, partial [Candidatus Kapabacteria bacterium]|nr:hypothetical protein [Candidatus Kapabacteria bacterium]